MLPAGNLGPLAKSNRIDAIRSATSWHGGTQSNRSYVETHFESNFCVSLGKPGKEADPNFKKPNLNDMAPTVFFGSQKLDFMPTFENIWQDLEALSGVSSNDGFPSSLEIIGALLFRSAYMLDHKKSTHGSTNSLGMPRSNWTWAPPTAALQILRNRHKSIGKAITLGSGQEIYLSPSTYLQIVDAISYNEDVKYQAQNVSLGASLTTTGRINTLLTCVHMIAGFMGAISITDLVSKMMRAQGVSPISQKDARKYFSLLN